MCHRVRDGVRSGVGVGRVWESMVMLRGSHGGIESRR